MNKYQLWFFDESVSDDIYKTSFTMLSIITIVVFILLVIGSLAASFFVIDKLNKEIDDLKHQEAVVMVDKSVVAYFIDKLDGAVGMVDESDSFVKEIFEVPFITSHFEYDKFVGNYTSPKLLRDLLYLDSTYDKVSLSHLKRVAEVIDTEIEKRNTDYNLIVNHLEEQYIIFAHTPSIWPTETHRVTSGFGFRRSPFTGAPSFHEGTDFGARTGTPNLAAADGVVVYTGTKTGYGYLITIDHGFGFITRYAHNSKFMVKVGDFVKKGDVIALSGATGRVAGPHLHFEILYNGTPVNAIKFIPNEGKKK